LLANTSFTREEIEKWHEDFLKDCPSGLLDKKSSFEFIHRFHPEIKIQKYGNMIFKAVDTDHSGTVDFTEFLMAFSVTSNGDVRQKLHFAFQIADKNHNGKLLIFFQILKKTN
jgi:Ca2+-binding EF-hand superfamily protein